MPGLFITAWWDCYALLRFFYDGCGIMKKALIFGIGGFVGPYLAREFLDHEYQVFGSDIHWDYGLQQKVEFHQADLLNSEEVEALIDNIRPDVIVNLAAISSVGLSWGIPQTTISVNVVGALNILEAAKKCDPQPKVLFIGSSEEYAVSEKPIDEKTPLDANNPYGISKMALEKFVELYRNRYGMKVYYVRPFNHTGVGQKDTFVLPSFCKQAAEIEKSGKPGIIKVGNLAAKRDFSDARDIVRAYRMIIESDDCTKVFNVGSGKAYSLRSILDHIVSLCSQPVSVEVDPQKFRPVDNPMICCNCSYIKNELGWEPNYTVFDSVKEMFEYYITI